KARVVTLTSKPVEAQQTGRVAGRLGVRRHQLGRQPIVKIRSSQACRQSLTGGSKFIVHSPPLTHMTTLKVHFATGEPFLDHYLADLPNGGLFFPTRRALAIGETGVISIRLGKRRSPMLLRGTVVWRRPGKHRTKTKAGIGVEFLPSESQTRDYLVAVAKGDSAEMVARRHQRLP